MTSSNDWYYMERSDGNDAFIQPFNFVTGIMAFDSYFDDRATATLALDRVGKETVTPFAFGTGPGRYEIVGRVTALPIYKDEGQRLLHVGVGYALTGTGNDFFAANRPLVRAGTGSTDVPNTIFTGDFFTADPVQLFNAELAAVHGRFSMSAEYQCLRGTNLYDNFTNGVFSSTVLSYRR